MQWPGVLGLVFLVMMLVIVPRGAIRSRRVLGIGQATDPDQPVPGRRWILIQTIVTLVLLGLLTWATGSTLDYDPLALPERFGVREAAVGLAALGLCGVAGWAARRVRTPEERRNLAIYRWMPQTGAERGLFVISALLAGLVEEAAYRGVLVAVLGLSLGSYPAAVAISAVAFAVAHAVQGWQSGVAILGIALVMQGVVWLTGTLLVAMVVHAVYDIIAGIMAGNEARRLSLESTPNPETPREGPPG